MDNEKTPEQIRREFVARLVSAQMPIIQEAQQHGKPLYLETASRVESPPKPDYWNVSALLLPTNEDGVDTFAEQIAKMLSDDSRAYFVGLIPRMIAVTKHANKQQVYQKTRVLWLDIDHVSDEDLPRILEKLPVKPNWITRSGHGFHLYFVLEDAIPVTVAESIMRGLSALVGGDHTQDATRILRISGTWNRKHEPAVLATFEVLHDEPHPVAAFESFAKAVPTTTSIITIELTNRVVTEEEQKQAVARLPKRIRKLIREGHDTEPGERTDLSRSGDEFTVISAMVKRGWDPDSIVSVMTNPAYAISTRLLEKDKQKPGSAAKRVLSDINKLQGQAAQEEAESEGMLSVVKKARRILERLEQQPRLYNRVFQAKVSTELVLSLIAKLQEQVTVLNSNIEDLQEDNTPDAKAERRKLEKQVKLLDGFTKQMLGFIPFGETYRAFKSEIIASKSSLRGQKQLYLDLLDWKFDKHFYEHHHFMSLSNFQQEMLTIMDDLGSAIKGHSTRLRLCIAQMATLFLEDYGQFLYTPSGTGDFNTAFPASTIHYRDSQNRIIVLDTDDFDKLLSNLLYLNRKDDKQQVVSHIAARFRQYTRAQVGFISQYNSETQAVYMDKGHGLLLKITANEPPVVVSNGTDNVFLRGQVTPWKYIAEHKGNFLDLLTMASVDTTSSKLSLEQTRFALKTWIIANFLRGLIKHYTLLSLIGERGSGKTTLAENIVRFVFGNYDYTAENPPREERDFAASCVHKGIFVVDNMEQLPRWDMMDALARLFNRGTITQRRLYSDDSLYEFKTDNFLILTAMDASWSREDVASRSLVVQVKDWFASHGDSMETQEEHLQNIIQHRDEIYSEIVDSIQRLLVYLQSTPLRTHRVKHRLESYAMVISAWAAANNESINIKTFWTAFQGQQVNLNRDNSGLAEFLSEYLDNEHDIMLAAWHLKYPGKMYQFEFELTASALHRKLSQFHGKFYDSQIKSANALGIRLKQSAPVIAEAGVIVTHRTVAGVTRWKINYFQWAANHLVISSNGSCSETATNEAQA